MKIKEFGTEYTEIAIFIHGGGLSWWSYRDVTQLMAQQRYHVILPIIDGHAQSDRDFVSIEDNAKEIIAYIDNNYQGHVKLLAGLSLGAQILVDILSQRKDICDYAVIESALVIPMKITNQLIGPSVSMSYSLIKKEWFSKVQFKSLRMLPALYEEYYHDTFAISKENMIAFLKANSSYQLKEEIKDSKAEILIMVGKKEDSKMIKSAEKMHCILAGSKLIEFENWYHGEASINHSKQYVEVILDFVKQ